MDNTDKLAVLIDADNAQPSIVDSFQVRHQQSFNLSVMVSVRAKQPFDISPKFGILSALAI